jgi:hypothetical protein
MILAIANREDLVDQAEQLAREEEDGRPLPCGAQDRDDPKLFCVNEVGHAGRHAYRRSARMH